jgi:hypothetical protein
VWDEKEDPSMNDEVFEGNGWPTNHDFKVS